MPITDQYILGSITPFHAAEAVPCDECLERDDCERPATVLAALAQGAQRGWRVRQRVFLCEECKTRVSRQEAQAWE